MVVDKYDECFIGYANLSAALVKKGDKIKKDFAVGNAGKNLDDMYTVEIMLNINGQETDPTRWFGNKDSERITW